VGDPDQLWASHQRASATRAQFLRGQVEAILATDFFTVDLLDGPSAHVLAVIGHATRRIRILGVTDHPNHARVTQMARNLLTDLDEQVESVKFLLRDRDAKFHCSLPHGVHRRCAARLQIQLAVLGKVVTG